MRKPHKQYKTFRHPCSKCGVITDTKKVISGRPNVRWFCPRCIGFILSRYSIGFNGCFEPLTSEEAEWKKFYDNLMLQGIFGYDEAP